MNPDTLNTVASLPWNLQIVLGSGYLAYLLAYFGLRHQHKPVDAIFLTISFGAVATLVVWALPGVIFPARLTLAFLASIATAILWRVWGRDALRNILRKTGYSWADDTNSAWEHLQECTDAHPIQLTVETSDGWHYFCTDTTKLKAFPFNPYILGTSGDVLMYADYTQGPTDDEPKYKADLIDPHHGANVTYLPASQVRRVMIRYNQITSSKAGVVAKVAMAVAKVWSKLRHRGTAEERGA